jgi:ribosomal protein S18 acetylase RimI-like enzyme
VTQGDISIRRLEKADYDYVVSVLDRWWGGPSGQRADPMYLYEFGEHALVAESGGQVIGFLLGFVVQALGFIHLVGIDPTHRRRRVGQALYERFTTKCAAAGVQELKAIAAVGNEASVAFHVALGFSAQEVEDYAGPGRARLVFTKRLTE